MGRPRLTVTELLSRVVVTSEGCWLRLSSHDKYGYCKAGQHTYGSGHRASWTLLRGPIPLGRQVDHLCRNTWCLNPSHMELVGIVENVKRQHRDRAYCKNGHPLTSENVWVGYRRGSVRRICKSCARERARGKAQRSGHHNSTREGTSRKT